MDQITLKQLRALAAVVEHGTIAQAAQILSLTGPAVHSQLKTLEGAVGSPLLMRDGKGPAVATPQGEAVLAAGHQITATLDRALYRIQALERGQLGSVVLGVVSTAKYFAPRIVHKLRQEMPEVDVVLKVGNRSETMEELARGSYDLCIMGRPPREALGRAVRLADHPHVLIAAPEHRLVGREVVEAKDLAPETFVMREPGSGTRILANRFLADVGGEAEVNMIEMTSNETIKQSVISGLGVALISAHTVADELAHGLLVTLPMRGLPLDRQWFLIGPENADKAPAAVLKASAYITEHIDEMLPRLSL